jgi:hypothetical protein
MLKLGAHLKAKDLIDAHPETHAEFLEFDEISRRKVISRLGLIFGSLIILATLIRCLIIPTRLRSIYKSLIFACFLMFIPVLVKKNAKTTTCGTLMILGVIALGIDSGMTNGGMIAPGQVYLLLPLLSVYFSMDPFGGRMPSCLG